MGLYMFSPWSLQVELMDACVASEWPLAGSSVRVASVASLDLAVVARVELGGHVEAVVVALAADGHPVPGHALMAIRVVAKDAIVAVAAHGHTAEGHARFLLQGEAVGDTSLVATAEAGPQEQVTGGKGKGEKRELVYIDERETILQLWIIETPS